MTSVDLHGVCVVGVVDVFHHTTVEEADVITVSRGYGIEARPLLPPPESLWFLLYTSAGAQFQTSAGVGVFVRRETT